MFSTYPMDSVHDLFKILVHDDSVVVEEEHCVRGDALGKLEHF